MTPDAQEDAAYRLRELQRLANEKLERGVNTIQTAVDRLTALVIVLAVACGGALALLVWIANAK